MHHSQAWRTCFNDENSRRIESPSVNFRRWPIRAHDEPSYLTSTYMPASNRIYDVVDFDGA